MKPHYLAFALAAVITYSCQKEEPPPPDNSSEKEVPQATIDPSGGKLSVGGLSVNIPRGAFQDAEILELTELTDSSFLGENAYSKQYRLEGLPEFWDQPLELAIKYDGELKGESFILMGEEAINMQTGESDVFCEFLSGTDSSGYLLCEIPGKEEVVKKSHPQASAAASGKKWITFQVVSNFFSAYSSRNNITYKILVPANNSQAFSPAIIKYFDKACETIETSILPYLDHWRLAPYNIYMAKLPDSDYCRFAWKNGDYLNYKMPRGIFAINTKKMDEAEKMEIMVGREVLRSALFTYDLQYPHLRKPDQIPHYWLDQAIICWSELEFSSDGTAATKSPSEFKGHEMQAFQGMHAGSLAGTGSLTENAAMHGRGMAPFIEYLALFFGEYIIEEIYTKISEGAHPVEAVEQALKSDGQSSTQNDIHKVYYSFLKEYLKGLVFPVQTNTFLQGIPESRVFDIDNENDTVKVFQDVYPDLSARLFRINMNDPVFKEKGGFEFVLTGGNAQTSRIEIGIFGLKDDAFTYLGDDLKIYEPKDFRDYTSLLVMVMNGTANKPYTGNSTVEFTVYANHKISLPINHCEFEISIRGDYERKRIPQGETEPTYSNYPLFGKWKFEGKCEGYEYLGKLVPEYMPSYTTGTLRVLFEEDNLDIENFSLTLYRSSLQPDSLTLKVEGNTLKKAFQSGNYLHHDLTGNSVCTPIENVFEFSQSTHAQGGYIQYKLLDFNCTEESLLKFRFR